VLYLGIDPGRSGACALVGDEGAWTIKCTATERDLWEWLDEHAITAARAVIEKVHAMPGQGVTSMFRFGESYGSLRAWLIALSVPFEAVTPGRWQKVFGLMGKWRSNREKKNAHKARAQELFPGVTVTHAVADALLLAEYARRTA